MVMKLSGNAVSKTDDSKYLKTTGAVLDLSSKGKTLVDDIMIFLTGNEDQVFAYKDIVNALAASKPVKYSDIRNRDIKSVMPFLTALHPEVVE